MVTCGGKDIPSFLAQTEVKRRKWGPRVASLSLPPVEKRLGPGEHMQKHGAIIVGGILGIHRFPLPKEDTCPQAHPRGLAELGYN